MEGSLRTEALTRAGSQHVSAEQRGAALPSVLVRWHVCGVLQVVAGASDEDGAWQRRGATGFRLSEAWQGKHEVHKGRNALRTSGFPHGEEKSARGVGQLSKPMPTASMARNHRLRRPVRSSAARLAGRVRAGRAAASCAPSPEPSPRCPGRRPGRAPPAPRSGSTRRRAPCSPRRRQAAHPVPCRTPG